MNSILEKYNLENSDVHFGFNKQGALCEMLDKRSGRRYIHKSGDENPFRLFVPTKFWDGRYADGKNADVPSVLRTDTTLTFRYTKIIAADGEILDCGLEIRAELRGDELLLILNIANSGNCALSHMMFPVVNGFESENSSLRVVRPVQSIFSNDRVLNPFSLGDGNHKAWTRMNNRKDARYPQMMSTSWMDYSDGQGGVSFEQRDPGFGICDFGFERLIKKSSENREKNRENIQFALQTYPNCAPGETVESPLFIISLHEGDWHIPARRHREWLYAHVQMAEVPRRFRESLGWHFYFMKQQDGTVYHDYNDLPRMAKAALDAGVNNIMVFGWFGAGHDNAYPFGYYANEDWGGANKLREKIAECEKLGCAVIPFFNGTLLDIAMQEYREYGYRWPVLGRTGEPYCGAEFSRANNDLAFENAMLTTTTRNMTLLDICITAREVQEWWIGTVKRIVDEYGFRNLQLDQIAHKSYVCYDKKHGHTRPELAYTIELQDLLSKVRKVVRTKNPEGIMVGEGMTDLTAQYCDGFWNWNQAHNRPEIMRYSIPWMSYSTEVDANEFDVANVCFAEKILMDLKIEGGDGILSDFPAFSNHLHRLSDLKKRVVCTYIDGEYCHHDNLDTVENEHVLIRIYRNDKAKMACIVCANITNNLEYAEFRLSTAPVDPHLCRLGGEECKMDVSGEYHVELVPYEVVVMEFNI